MTKKTSPVATLPKGKGTQNTTPPPSNPAPIPRSEPRDEKDEPTKDTLRLQKDKARWPGYGADKTDTATLLAEQRTIEGKGKLSSGAQSEEEEEDASDLTVAQLKEALDAAKVEYPANAKKADLVKLYEDNELGGE
jgi:hypothetical protein